jgi:antitoxin ParD1/3/4
MGLHISLPKALKDRVHEAVQSGMYASESELVREALRDFFSAREDIPMSAQEAAQLRAELDEREARIARGESQWVDGEAVFKDMEAK